MEVSISCKVDAESQTFHEEWTNLYYFIQHGNNPACLICKNTMTEFKEQDLKSHFEAEHKEKYGKILGANRDKMITKLRQKFEQKVTSSHNLNAGIEAEHRASYRVAHILSKNLRPFSDGEYIKKCMLAVVEEMCPEKKDSFRSINLSTRMITKRVRDMEKTLSLTLKRKATRFEVYSIAADMLTDSKNNVQLLVFVRGINSSFEITEELAAKKCMRSSMTPVDLFKEVSDLIQNYSLSWSKLVGMTVNGGSSAMGNHNGLAGRICRKVAEFKGDKPLRLQCIIDQQSLCINVLNLGHVINTVVSIVNFIKTQASNHRIYNNLFRNIKSEYEEIFSQNEVCWLGGGILIKRFFDLRHEIDTFMRQKSVPVDQLNDPAWLWDLAFLCDITPHLNELIKKIQKKEELISHLYSDVTAFQAKLKLFIRETKNGTLTHFPSCVALRSEKKLNTYFPKTRITQLLGYLRDNFNDRFTELKDCRRCICLFGNPFAVNPLRYQNELQRELVNLQRQPVLQERFRIMQPVEFYSKLPAETFPNLRKLALKMITMFTSTHVYDKAAKIIKRARYTLKDQMTNEHLDSVIRIGASSMLPKFKALASRKTSKNPSTTSEEIPSKKSKMTITVDTTTSSKIVDVMTPVVNFEENVHNPLQ